MKINWLPPAVMTASEWLADAINLADLSGSTVWLAVTGLSRAGKTVFITSLIHNMLSAVHNPNRMPLFDVVGERRLIAANLESARAQLLPQFPYQRNIEAMAPARRIGRSAPPTSARSTSTCIFCQPVASANWSAKSAARRDADPPDRRLSGGMAARSAADGSDLCRVVARHPAHVPQGRAGRTVARLPGVHRQRSADENASEEAARRAHDLYCAALPSSRPLWSDLSAARPFLMPRQSRRSALSVVLAAGLKEGTDTFAPHRLGALMDERFEVYKREAVAHFYEEHFRRFTGRSYWSTYCGRCSPGVTPSRIRGSRSRHPAQLPLRSGGLMSRLLYGPHIDKVLFAATKADHVPEVQRDHLAMLLRNMAAFRPSTRGQAMPRSRRWRSHR